MNKTCPYCKQSIDTSSQKIDGDDTAIVIQQENFDEESEIREERGEGVANESDESEEVPHNVVISVSDIFASSL